jgi:hypothetical protein
MREESFRMTLYTNKSICLSVTARQEKSRCGQRLSSIDA